MMLDLTRAEPTQGHLFFPERPELERAMEALDRVNARFGKRTVTFGTEVDAAAEAEPRLHHAVGGHGHRLRPLTRDPACWP